MTVSGIQEFIAELGGFAVTAEETLRQIEADMEKNRGMFSVFSDRMIAIRGTAQQLSLPKIAHIARLGEEIAMKGVTAEKRPQIRKAVGSLWDALTTVKHLLQHHGEETAEEHDILVNRLEATLRAFGGARQQVDADEIERMLREKK
ncbi:MAG: hypothetical protein IT285_05345 [Bdellovibrionales bacterium]|nr:hypothetical protein [Bdellovibrionales bacterium]